jgi:3,4-dihydroxy 2-butanone 4-phosphate synthase/GTP cyclohydrolase II
VRGLEVGRTPHNEAYLRTKATQMGHVLHLPPGTQREAIPVMPVRATPTTPGVDTADHPFDPLEDLA